MAASRRFQCAGKADAKRQAALKSGDHKGDPNLELPDARHPTAAQYGTLSVLIMQTTRNVTFLQGSITLSGSSTGTSQRPRRSDVDPTYLGSTATRAHLEGKSLVIDSVGFNDLTWLDYTGLPHGEKLTVQERYVLSDPATINAAQ